MHLKVWKQRCWFEILLPTSPFVLVKGLGMLELYLKMTPFSSFFVVYAVCVCVCVQVVLGKYTITELHLQVFLFLFFYVELDSIKFHSLVLNWPPSCLSLQSSHCT